MEAFNGRNFLITGGASGIGLATAHLLLAEGARVILWDVNETELSQLSRDLGVTTAVIDVTQSAQVAQGVADTISQLDSLDGVVHSAGMMCSGRFENLTVTRQQRMIEVNLTGTIVVTNALLPYVKSSRGSLILLASVSAFYGPPEFAAYGASKAGVLCFGQAMRLELEPSGIHVGIVCPFFVSSPMLNKGIQTKMFKRFGVAHTPEDVAAAILHGIRRRQFMIWPSYYPAFFHWLSHVVYPFRHLGMRWFWR